MINDNKYWFDKAMNGLRMLDYENLCSEKEYILYSKITSVIRENIKTGNTKKRFTYNVPYEEIKKTYEEIINDK
jgi:hypothetical protein